MRLIPTTDRKLIETLQCSNYAVWGAPAGLSLDAYIQRDWTNYESEYMDLCRADRTTLGGVYFVMLDDVADNETVLGGCEIIIRPMWTTTHGDSEKEKEKEIKTVKCATIGSVYVMPNARGRGIAKEIMAQLTRMLDAEYLPGVYDVSMLYSEVGTKIYEDHGYVLSEEGDEYVDDDDEEGNEDITMPAGATVLRTDSPDEHFAHVEKLLHEENWKQYTAAVAVSSPRSRLVSVVPTRGCLQWHARRALARAGTDPVVLGWFTATRYRMDGIAGCGESTRRYGRDPHSLPMLRIHTPIETEQDQCTPVWVGNGKWCWF